MYAIYWTNVTYLSKVNLRNQIKIKNLKKVIKNIKALNNSNNKNHPSKPNNNDKKEPLNKGTFHLNFLLSHKIRNTYTLTIY